MEPEKTKAGLREPKIKETAGVSKDGQLGKTAMEIGLGKVENHSTKTNAGTEGLQAGTGKMKVETAWVKKVMKLYD